MASSTREKILETAERLIRRLGPQKLAVVDIARALDMSHGNVYRHFSSKAAILDAVAERWLRRIADPLEAIANEEDAPADERLERWFLALHRAKVQKITADPEVFAMYHAIAEKARGVVQEHVDHLQAQVARILRDGMASGVFSMRDPVHAADLALSATLAFHHPSLLQQTQSPDQQDRLRQVLALLIAGLKAGSK